jgi:hypothetical protein
MLYVSFLGRKRGGGGMIIFYKARGWLELTKCSTDQHGAKDVLKAGEDGLCTFCI